MRRALLLPLPLLAALTASSQPATPALAGMLSFEAPNAIGGVGGWGGTSGATSLDHETVHGGKSSARIDCPATAANKFCTVTRALSIDFTGSRIEFRGWLRTEDVSGWAGLWLREDGEGRALEFDNMQARGLKGTTDWKQYSITLRLNPEARTMVFGALLTGTGKLWVDDLEMLVDGRPVWEAPKTPHEVTALDKDHEFDGGSRVTAAALNATQIENLVTLGKVWGFGKYHHPAVVSGQRHWDYDLYRILPAVLSATSREEANAAIGKWMEGLGPVPPCANCARLNETALYMRPDLDWIKDQRRLGAALSERLQAVYAARPADGKQFYLTVYRGVNNPQFLHELGYGSVKLPDAGLQILAAYRFWNVVEYWSPYRDIIGADWDGALRKHIGPIALAATPHDYQRELMALIAELHDTHANLWSSMQVRPPEGQCALPVRLQFIDHRPVVIEFASEDARSTGLERGDAIEALDGAPVAKLAEEWKPYYADSNDAARERDMAMAMTRGACGEVKLGILREGKPVEVTVARVSPAGIGYEFRHDLAGAAFRRLSDDVAYLKLSAFKIADVQKYLDSAAGTKGMIIDIRNYPSEFAPFSLGQSLVDKPTDFVKFTLPDLANPGAYHFGPPLTLRPQQPHYAGKVVILVDEITQSSAEYTSMALRTAPGAKVVGSMTAGADGNVSNLVLPGSQTTMLSGIGVFYPDGKPTQRVGIVPDVAARPTVEGVRAGRDEVLEAGIREILGAGASEEEVRRAAKH